MSNLMPMTGSPSLTTPRDDQPASEWASSTLSAFDPTSDVSTEKEPFYAADETPGLDIPGGFPTPKQGIVETDMHSAKEAAMDVLGTAKQFAQTAAQSAQTAIQNAGEKVGDYLPTGVASYLPSKQSVGTGGAEENTKMLPSEETSQDYPSTSGDVGVLPGFAVLPHERTGSESVDKAVSASTDVTKTSPIMTTTNNNHPHSDPLSRHTGYIPETLQDDTNLAQLPEEHRLESLPSHDDETKGLLGKSDGVGALPGSVNETSVVLLPDERDQPKEKTTSDSSTFNNASTDASIRTLPGSPHDGGEVGQIHLHDSPHTEAREHALARDEEKVFGSDTLKKYQIDTDVPGLDAKGQKADASLSGDDLGSSKPPKESSTDSLRAVGVGSGGLAGAGTSQPAPLTSPKKSGFVHKVKGEMKILSGKMSHNESKVEEGRKMAGKN